MESPNNDDFVENWSKSVPHDVFFDTLLNILFIDPIERVPSDIAPDMNVSKITFPEPSVAEFTIESRIGSIAPSADASDNVEAGRTLPRPTPSQFVTPSVYENNLYSPDGRVVEWYINTFCHFAF